MHPPEGASLTFLFTDIEGSTRLWEQVPDFMRPAHALHLEIVERAVLSHGGRLLRDRGEGDSTFSVFDDPLGGVLAIRDIQMALHGEDWPSDRSIRIRAALHSGQAVPNRFGTDFNSSDVNRCARIRSLAAGGQTLVSEAVYRATEGRLPHPASYLPLGSHRLKDLSTPEQLYQLHHPDLPADFPALRSLGTLPTNLPEQLTSFIGREREMEEVVALLNAHRLVTVTGSGGCGKTRLALQAAADLLDEFPDGVWLADLAPLGDADLVARTVASALGVRESQGREYSEAIEDFLPRKTLLLLLDNCEHVIQASADLAVNILRCAPNVRILATSREPLSVPGEARFRAPSLTLPEQKVAESPESVLSCESARLFQDRAQQVRADFQVDAGNAAALASICRRLDGIPLAIELAAARASIMTVEEVNDRLDKRFRLLTGGHRTSLPRQQTLRSLIDWSYDLLTDEERALFCRLAVFSGGWDLDAAEGVCGDPPDSGPGDGNDIRPERVIDLLQSLADKSLVIAEEQALVMRYRMLVTVRMYALDRLAETGEPDAWRGRHLRYFARLAEQTPSRMAGREQSAWLDRLESDHDNFRAALRYASDAGSEQVGQLEDGMRMAGSLWRFWYIRGHVGEGQSWLEGLLGKAERQDSSAAGMALHAAANLAYQQGDYSRSRALFEEALRIRRALGERAHLAFSLGGLGLVAHEQGDYGAAQARFDEALAIFREVGDEKSVPLVLANLGRLAANRCDPAAASGYYHEGIRSFHELGDRWSEAHCQMGLAYVAIDKGEGEEARRLLLECLDVFTELADERRVAHCLQGLGTLASEQGDPVEARRRFCDCLSRLSSFLELGTRDGLAQALEAAAVTVSALVGADTGARLLGAAERMREETGTPHAPNERAFFERHARSIQDASKSEMAFRQAWLEGRGLSAEEVLKTALDCLTEAP